MKSLYPCVLAALICALLSSSMVMARSAAVIHDAQGNVVMDDVDESDIQDLVELLGDDRADVREQARNILVGFGGESVGPLLEGLQKGVNVRETINALGEIGDKRALVPVTAYLKSEDKTVSSEARLAAIAFGDMAVPRLVELAGQEGFTDRAIDILKRVRKPSEESYKQVRQLLQSGKSEIRAGAVEVLGLWKDVELAEDIYGLVKDQDPKVRRSALEAYRNATKEYDRELLTGLLNDNDLGVRGKAAELLQHVPHESNVEPLIELYNREPDGMVRSVVLAALAETGDPRAADLVLKGLDDDDPNVVISALWYVDDLKVDGAAGKIVEIFREKRPVINKDKLVLQEALLALTNLGERVDISPFLSYLDTRQEYATRKLLLEMLSAIGKSGDDEVIAALEKYSETEDNTSLKNLADKTLEKLK